MTSDLPVTTDDEAIPDEGTRREFLRLFLIAAVTLVLLTVGLALRYS